ncbi:MAG: protease inhibitor I42 family protein [Candidatus Omnitrophica bacterium]|nr:protease inhibitor I42 family protein [Candidatus Omnitrophota bacterium]
MKIGIMLVFLAFFSFAFADVADTVQATVGKEFVITMEANATTGYSWELADPIDESQISLVSSEYVPANTDLVGAGGKSVWTFKALRVSKAKISFKYVRPWEKDVPPAKVSAFIVDIRNKK